MCVCDANVREGGCVCVCVAQSCQTLGDSMDCVCVCVCVAQSCQTLGDSMDCSPPGMGVG